VSLPWYSHREKWTYAIRLALKGKSVYEKNSEEPDTIQSITILIFADIAETVYGFNISRFT
jgi:hypothetical protein